MSLVQQCERSVSLVKELQRKPQSLPAYNQEQVRSALAHIHCAYDTNLADVRKRDGAPLSLGIQTRHAAIERHTRCLLCYTHERAKRVCAQRWNYGAVLPAHIRVNLSESEKWLYASYSRALSDYTRSLCSVQCDGRNGGAATTLPQSQWHSGGTGGSLAQLDITLALKPPKGLLVKVRSLSDFGEMVASDGSVMLLRRNSIHVMRRSDAEPLVQQAILEHIAH